MEQCLYHPQWGYYNQGASRVGREGDFYTSVSVGKCFGMLLAHRIVSYLDSHQLDSPIELIEVGANSGQLACDILDTLQQSFPDYYTLINYTICEHLESMQQVQRQTLDQYAHKLSFHKNLADIKKPFAHGIILSNELIDAFPVKILTKKEDDWLEKVVSSTTGGFEFTYQPISSPAAKEFARNLSGQPDGYITEFRPGLEAFANTCSAVIETGLVITVDYGHNHSSYYSSERNTGTLQTFHEHTKGDNPLQHLGEQDITAHVDFTQLAKAYEMAKLEPCYFDTQSRYLTEHASNWFQQIENSGQAPPAKLIRQFQTLTHPAMMGRQFHVLECVKNGEPQQTARTKLEL